MADTATSSLDFGVDVNKIKSIIGIENTDLNDTNFFGISSDDDNADADAVDNSTVTQIDEDKMKNPFYVSTNGGQLFKMNNRDIYHTYDRVIVISLSKNYSPEHQHVLMQKYIGKDQLNEIKESLHCYTGSLKMLKLHKKTATIVDRYILNQINTNKTLVFNNDEIVVCLFELEESDAELYVDSLFSDNYDFNNLTKILLLFLRYNGDLYGQSLKRNISRYVNNLTEASYWENRYNCQLNMTDAFMKRTFANTIDSNSKFQTKSASELIKKIIGGNSTHSDYLQGIDGVYKKTEFVDGASATKDKTTKYRLYKIKDQDSFTREQVTELFQIISDTRILYDMFNAFLLSKDYCHLVINNKDVLQIMQPTIRKYMPLYKLLFGYAWICLYTEECIKKSRSSGNDRYVFSIDDASALPDFPYTTNDVHTSPYMAILIAKNAINSEKNCMGLGQIKSGFENQNSISTFDEFKIKLNVFTTGKVDKCIFTGLPSDENGKWLDFAVSGSVITACVPKHNPLMNLVTNPDTDEVGRLNRYFNEYYKKSDIDVICTRSCIFEFMDKVQELKEVIIKNLNDIAGKDVSSTIKITPYKSLRIAISPEYIERCMPDKEVDDVVNNLNSPEIRDDFYFKYMSIKQTLNKNMANIRGKNSLYSMYLKPTDYDDMLLLVSPYKTLKHQVQKVNSDYYIFLNDVLSDEDKVPDEENILIFKLSEGIKFKIESEDSNENEKYLLHGIEVFKSKYPEVFSIVSRFHLPCVRGYYCGNDVKLLPSCISAHKTSINGDYRYISGKWDPIHILDKYRSRGLGTVLNSTENLHMVEYNKESEEWKDIFKIDGSKNGINQHLGYRTINDEIFKLGKHRDGLPDDIYRKLDYTYIASMDDLYAVYKDKFGYDPKKCGLDLLMFKTINDNGSVRPFNRSWLDVVYDLL